MAARDTTPPPKLRKLSVVVPVFNERNTLVEILRRMRAVELPDSIEREIIVVDDGSDDGTRDVLKQLGDSTVRIIMHERNRGKGAAVRTGVANATGEYVLVQDADLEYDPDDWRKLLNPILRGRTRVVYGSRFTGERRNMLFLHWIGNRFLSLTTNVLYNTTLSDMETCYKVLDRRLFDDLSLSADRFDIEPEITAKILKRGIRIYEVP
ncbi:MAG TPA: glycosyltransferase family 2 protein, partial [Acidimicrobiia bacterium]|nr:glycosyltransferase family 2 protein [Acidimicrobiia bacterium]